MTEAAQQPNQPSDQLYNQAGVVNKVAPKKSVYMRSRDMAEFEKEIETSRLAAENADKPSAPANEPENPNSANTPTPEEVNWQKRYADVQSDRDKKLADANKRLAEKDKENLELANKLKETQKAKTKYPTSEEELAQWIKEFPPLAPIIQTLALKAWENDKSELANEIKELQEFKKAYANERGRTELLKIHPDANEIEADPRFALWFNEQEPEIQLLVSSGEPKKIGKAISLFKKELGIVTKTAQDLQREASRTVNLGPTPPDVPREQRTWYESEVNKMNAKQYAANELEIEKARSEGRYIYDLSRAS